MGFRKGESEKATWSSPRVARGLPLAGTSEAGKEKNFAQRGGEEGQKKKVHER